MEKGPILNIKPEKGPAKKKELQPPRQRFIQERGGGSGNSRARRGEKIEISSEITQGYL